MSAWGVVKSTLTVNKIAWVGFVDQRSLKSQKLGIKVFEVALDGAATEYSTLTFCTTQSNTSVRNKVGGNWVSTAFSKSAGLEAHKRCTDLVNEFCARHPEEQCNNAVFEFCP